MNPIPVFRAANTREKLSLVYMFAAWNLLAVVAYQVFYNKDVNAPKRDGSGKN